MKVGKLSLYVSDTNLKSFVEKWVQSFSVNFSLKLLHSLYLWNKEHLKNIILLTTSEEIQVINVFSYLRETFYIKKNHSTEQHFCDSIKFLNQNVSQVIKGSQSYDRTIRDYSIHSLTINKLSISIFHAKEIIKL